MRFGSVLHDAGSSNLILSYLKDFTKEIDMVFSGPSQQLISRKPLNSKTITLDYLMKNSYDVIFLSLNEYSKIDKQVMNHFKNSTTLFITFLDHWSFSLNEFELHRSLVLPDQFIVTDNYAESRAKEFFPNSIINLLENSYISEFKSKFNASKKMVPQNKILFLSEKVNVSKNPKFAKLYTCSENCNLEFHAFDYFMRNIGLMNIKNPHIVIRPHPAQSVNDFGEEYFNYSSHITISSEMDLINDLMDTKIAIGIHSIALLIAQEVGIKVFTCLPPGSENIAIPGNRIPYIRHIKP